MTRRPKSTLPAQVIRTVREQDLFAPGHHLLVAVSGGPDSVALLSVLSQMAPDWHLKITAVHFNYRLRGRESDGDEAFVSALCRQRQIPLMIRRPTLSKGKRQSSLQALARDVRYAAMKSIAHEVGADRIVVGHTANDQVETILMWMLRGAGLTGLAGMPFIRESLIIRPLLAVTRKDILNYLMQEKLRYRQDSSNASLRYRRNRIRRELVPVMEEIAPATVRLLQRQADLLCEDNRYMERVVKDLYGSLVMRVADGGLRIDNTALAAIPVALQRRIIRMLLSQAERMGRPSSIRVVEDVRRFALNAREGARLLLRNVEVRRDGDTIGVNFRGLFRAEEKRGQEGATQAEIPVNIPSMVYWPGTGQEIQVQVMTKREVAPFLKKPMANRALFDADKFSEPLVVRGWRAGDRFYPSGMKGKSKKLQDLYTDLKVERLKRKSIPLLVAPEGILWVVGCRQDDRFLVHADSSRFVVAMVKTGSVGEGAR